jgi:hypothetical protein
VFGFHDPVRERSKAVLSPMHASATRGVDSSGPGSVLAVAVSQVADKQAAQRTRAGADQCPATAIGDAADYGAGGGAHANIPFSGRAPGQGC